MPATLSALDLERAFSARGRAYSYLSLPALAEAIGCSFGTLPLCLRVLLENVLRAQARGKATFEDVVMLANWQTDQGGPLVVPFSPGRVLMQDSTGLPVLVDLAALGDAVSENGGDPASVQPQIPVDLVVDHSVIVEHTSSPEALQQNMDREFARNDERYRFLRWAQSRFAGLRVVPPGSGICHQVNLEFLSTVVATVETANGLLACPDSLVGTDSHTTMANALGILAWGVGGLEAQAAVLGQPLEVVVPEVVGVRITGRPPAGVGATDLALTLAERLRKLGVTGSFLEFCGEGLDALSLADRATLANMAPEYGATCTYFPIDREALDYLAATGRAAAHVALVETYARAQGLWRQGGERPRFSRLVEFDLGSIKACVAGPSRPDERVPLEELAESRATIAASKGRRGRRYDVAGTSFAVGDDSVVTAAITSCTNTANPAAMIAAGLLARRAAKRGMRVSPWVTPSLAPGSVVVGDYLRRLGLQDDLDTLGFNIVAYGCGACVGNTAPLPPALAAVIERHDLDVVAVLSGNRNFAGRVNPLIKSSYLASPALVVAFALAGTVAIDLARDPIGIDEDAEPVYLRDLWPSPAVVQAAIAEAVTPAHYRHRADRLFGGTQAWQRLASGGGRAAVWNPASTYLRRPPFLALGLRTRNEALQVAGARILLLLGNGVTTDHISPAGPIPFEGPAADYLREHGVAGAEFNTYAARRGNHEVMLRGAFTNPRLDNALVPDRPGGRTRLFPGGAVMPVFDAAMRYREGATPLVILAGKDYGGGSSRDWAAKATALLGVQAVIAESFERIHRANLVAVGVLPLQFMENISWPSLDLDGSERLSLQSTGSLAPLGTVSLVIERPAARSERVMVLCRLDTARELATWRAGGLLPLLAGDITARSRTGANPPRATATVTSASWSQA